MKKLKWTSVSVYKDGVMIVWNDCGAIIYQTRGEFLSFLMSCIIEAKIEEDKKEEGGD